MLQYDFQKYPLGTIFLRILRKGNTLRAFDLSSKTRNDVARIFVKSASLHNGIYTETIFNATSLKIRIVENRSV